MALLRSSQRNLNRPFFQRPSKTGRPLNGTNLMYGQRGLETGILQTPLGVVTKRQGISTNAPVQGESPVRLR